MKAILLSDGHLLWEKPVSRIDDVKSVQFIKWGFVLEYAHINKCIILQAGDFFNRPRSWYLLPEVMKLLKKHREVPIYCVFGQHDTYMYSEKTREATSLGIVEIADMVHVLGNKPVLENGVDLYGCSYGQEVPKVKKDRTRIPAILVIHAPIAEKALWPGQQYMDATDFIKKHEEFDVILCGDIHQSFRLRYKGRWIVNTGPLIRREATLYNFAHRPGFFVYDSVDESMAWMEIPHRPAEEVLSRMHLEYEKEGESILNEFIASISSADIDEGADFIDNLWKFVKKNKIKRSVTDLLAEVVDGHSASKE